MDILTFLSSIINSLAWPIVTIAIVFILKKEISELLGRIKKIKHKESEIDLAFEINSAIKDANEVLKIPHVDQSQNQERIQRLAEDSPRGAILDSWLTIEDAMQNYSDRYEIKNTSQFGPYEMIRNIRMHNLELNNLGEGVFEMLSKLRILRNDAIHRTDAEITPEVAKDYANLAERVRVILEES